MKVLYALFCCRGKYLKINFRSYPGRISPVNDYKFRDFTINNLTYDVLKK